MDFYFSNGTWAFLNCNIPHISLKIKNQKKVCISLWRKVRFFLLVSPPPSSHANCIKVLYVKATHNLTKQENDVDFTRSSITSVFKLLKLRKISRRVSNTCCIAAYVKMLLDISTITNYVSNVLHGVLYRQNRYMWYDFI